MSDFFDQDGEDESEELPHEIIAEFIGAFMASGMNSDALYRQHFCDMVAGRIYNEFGLDGMCEMMMSLDRRADWISDIILEAPDLENIAFKKYGVYDPEISTKARQTKAIQELNGKLWRLRRKYARLIVDEIMAEKTEQPNDNA
jgi:hypothetical protein